MISKPNTPLDPFMQESNSPDGFSNRKSADGGIKEVIQQQPRSSDDVAQRSQTQQQLKRKGQPGELRSVSASTSQQPTAVHPDMLSFEMQKIKLDEQFKTDAPVKSRSRTTSQTSSQSSSSRGSIKSVIKKTNSQSTQPSRNIDGENGSKPKERKRSRRKEKQESQNTTRSDGNTHQDLQEFYMHPSRMKSLRRSSFGDVSSASSLEKMTQFIAKAINEDPEEVRKKLAAVEKQKAKVKSKKKQVPSSEANATSPDSRTSDFNPLASSSPETKSSPEKMVYSLGNVEGIEQHNSHISSDKLSSYTMEDSVFPSHDSPSMVRLSLKELDSKDFPSERESMSFSEIGNFKHVIPSFGETYTVRQAKKEADQQHNAPMIDPRKHRTHEIEQRLNRSLPQNTDTFASYDGNFSHPPISTRQMYPLTQEMTVAQSDLTPHRQRLETSDSAVGSMATSLSHDVTNSRHSWPETTPSRQHNQKEFHRADNGRDNTSQPGSSATVGALHHTVPSDNLRVAVQPGNLSEGLPSTLLIHGHHPANLVNQDYSPMSVPLSIAQGIVPLGNPGTVSHLYTSSDINGSTGVPGFVGPIFTGHGLNVHTHGPLSHTAPTAYGPRMVPLGSALYPALGHGALNTYHGHVPFVQTVSASMGPKPSSLTPTYVQSLNVNIPHNNPSQQIPLHLQTNASSFSALPTSFTQPRIPASLPFHQPPSQQMPNGLLQVRPDFSQGVSLPSPTQLIIPGEIKFPPFCCVGVLTESVIPLHNSSSRWMHCEIHSILSTANGIQVRIVKKIMEHYIITVTN